MNAVTLSVHNIIQFNELFVEINRTAISEWFLMPKWKVDMKYWFVYDIDINNLML